MPARWAATAPGVSQITGAPAASGEALGQIAPVGGVAAVDDHPGRPHR
jgi:hypothetical protein